MRCSLALGIGANTAIFSVVNAVLLRPLPYEAPEQLVFLQERISTQDMPGSSYLNFTDWRGQSTLFDSMAAVRLGESFNLTGSGEPERLQGRLVSAQFFTTLGIKPMRGRNFLAEEDAKGAAPAVILSHGFWEAATFDQNIPPQKKGWREAPGGCLFGLREPISTTS